MKLKKANYFFNCSNLKLSILVFSVLIFTAANSAAAVEIIKIPVEKNEEDLYHIEAEIPILLGLKSKNVQSKYNDLFRDDIFCFLESTIEMASQSQHNFAAAEIPMHQFEGIVDFEIKNNKQIFSIKFNYYQYTGGAHGNPYSLSYNIDLNSGEDLKLIDFLERINLTLAEVEVLIKSEIEKNPANYFHGDYGFQSLEEDQHYYLEAGKLVIYFQPYAVAPYSTGMPEFRVKY